MCDDYWGTADAQVVCRQLGYPTDSVLTFHNAYFGQGNGSIYMDDVSCVGTESSLFSCSYTSNHNCVHYEDASVRCGMYITYIDVFKILCRMYKWKHTSC